ncbi:MAG TPA: VOC family protein, partial [Candidatus Dormibacteraeota bacterium]|nr:VOC family protein [Candidatus Dormibacteraeota bacterium]
MAKLSLEPYLFFQANAKEAMEYYKGVFGGELTMQTTAELPKDMPTMPGSKPTDVMHSSLKSGAVDLMASDSSKASAEAAKVELSLGGTDEAQMRKIFDAFAEGGEVRMTLSKQFWGDIFGSVSDKYGVDWMMNVGSN